jgi:hypothetical protein
VGDFSRFELVAHHGNVFGARADEDDFVVSASMGEGRAFGKKTVSRVQRVASRAMRCCDQVLDFEVAVGGTRRTDATARVAIYAAMLSRSASDTA